MFCSNVEDILSIFHYNMTITKQIIIQGLNNWTGGGVEVKDFPFQRNIDLIAY